MGAHEKSLTYFHRSDRKREKQDVRDSKRKVDIKHENRLDSQN